MPHRLWASCGCALASQLALKGRVLRAGTQPGWFFGARSLPQAGSKLDLCLILDLTGTGLELGLGGRWRRCPWMKSWGKRWGTRGEGNLPWACLRGGTG